MKKPILALLAALAVGALPTTSHASFHLMQIEQVIGGVDGDTSAQAIQLRMRSFGENFVSFTRLYAYDADGLNPVLLLDISSDISNPNAGTRILLATANFSDFTTGTFTPDFTLANAIPASYLAAGKVTYENDTGSVLWSVAFGGAGYTGTNTGTLDNDADGNFGAAFAGPLPSTSLQALQFTGATSAQSTTNAADYALTSGAAVFTNSAGQSFTVVPEPGVAGLFALGVALIVLRWRRNAGIE